MEAAAAADPGSNCLLFPPGVPGPYHTTGRHCGSPHEPAGHAPPEPGPKSAHALGCDHTADTVHRAAIRHGRRDHHPTSDGVQREREQARNSCDGEAEGQTDTRARSGYRGSCEVREHEVETAMCDEPQGGHPEAHVRAPPGRQGQARMTLRLPRVPGVHHGQHQAACSAARHNGAANSAPVWLRHSARWKATATHTWDIAQCECQCRRCGNKDTRPCAWEVGGGRRAGTDHAA